MKSVLVSHPHAAEVAQRFAAILSSAGLLGSFVTGVAAVPGTLSGRGLERLGRRAPQLTNRVVRGVERNRLRSLSVVELGSRLVARVGRKQGTGKTLAYDTMYLAHDAIVGLLPWPNGIDGVYAYEDGALRTFRKADRKNVPRIWDLPLPHYASLEAMWIGESRRWPEAMSNRPPVEPDWKKRRKDAELRLASHVSVASQFTRESLEAVGCRLPVRVIPYGFPVERFRPKPTRPAGPFTVLAVGSHDLRKGTPYLLEAWRRADLRDARLRLIGPMKLSAKFLDPYRGMFEHVPYLPKPQLEGEYQAADVLAFPTLGDGFGLVIQEAMCCGTPVLTTRCGGGPECLEHDREGWIVPERHVDALVEQLRVVTGDRERAFAMGRAAQARAERYTWADAGAALSGWIASL